MVLTAYCTVYTSVSMSSPCLLFASTAPVHLGAGLLLSFAFPEQLGHQKRTERPLRRRRRSLRRFHLERIPLVGIDHLCFPTRRTAWDAAVVEVNVSMHKVLRLKLSQHLSLIHICGKIGQLARVQVLNLTSDVPKLFNESDDFLKDALFLRQILRI